MERKVLLKRNAFIIFMLNILPIVFTGGMVAIFIHKLGTDISKIVCCLFFIFALIRSGMVVKDNNRFLSFADGFIHICKDQKKNPKVIKRIAKNEIKQIRCNDKAKSLTIEFNDNSLYDLVRYDTVSHLGEQAFFLAKSEALRYFPEKCPQIQDERCRQYIETGIIPESILNAESSGKSYSIVITIVEFVFSIIPLFLALLSVAWVFCWIMIGILKGIIHILQLIA